VATIETKSAGTVTAMHFQRISFLRTGNWCRLTSAQVAEALRRRRRSMVADLAA
jgi:hypothetical protein